MAENDTFRHHSDAASIHTRHLVERVAIPRRKLVRNLAFLLKGNGGISAAGMATLIEMVQAAADPQLTTDEATIVVGRIVNELAAVAEPAAPADDGASIDYTAVLFDIMKRSGVASEQVGLMVELVNAGPTSATAASDFVEAMGNKHRIPRAVIDSFRLMFGLEWIGPKEGEPGYTIDLSDCGGFDGVSSWLAELWSYLPDVSKMGRSNLSALIPDEDAEIKFHEPPQLKMPTMAELTKSGFDKATTEGPGAAFGEAAHTETIHDGPAAGDPRPEPVSHREERDPYEISLCADVKGKVVVFGGGRIMVLLKDRHGARFNGYIIE